MQLVALFRLGFPTAPALLCLNLAAYGNSQAHSTKGTPSPLRALTACRSTVSGSLSLPSRGSFHLSLTVLCAIGSRQVFSLGGWSPLIPPGFLVSRRTRDLRFRPRRFKLRGFHPLWQAFPDLSHSFVVSHLTQGVHPLLADPATPPTQRTHAWHADGLGSSPFARRY